MGVRCVVLHDRRYHELLVVWRHPPVSAAAMWWLSRDRCPLAQVPRCEPWPSCPPVSSSVRPFVMPLTGTSCPQPGNGTFHDGAAVTTGTGQLHLERHALAVQARRMERG